MIAFQSTLNMAQKFVGTKFPFIPVIMPLPNFVLPVPQLSLSTEKKPRIDLNNFQSNKTAKNINTSLTLKTKFKFANYQKPTPQPIKKQAPAKQAKPISPVAPASSSTAPSPSSQSPISVPPPPSSTNQNNQNQDSHSDSHSKPLYTVRDMFLIMMSSVGVFLWGQILLKEYYKSQPPIPIAQPPQVIVQKVPEKSSQTVVKTQESQSLGMIFMMFLMCLFVLAAEFSRMRSFDKMYEELRAVHKVLKEQVHGIQLQLIRERLGSL